MGDIIHGHPNFICASQRHSRSDWPERWFQLRHVVDYVSYPGTNSLGILCQGPLDYPDYLKYSFFLNGFSLAGTEHCTGVSISPWVGLKQLSRRAIEICHKNMHQPPTWDRSDGPLLKFPHRATSTLVPKDLLSVYKA